MNQWGSRRIGRERVLIVGGGIMAQHAAWLLSHPINAMKYWVVGFVDNDMFKQGTRIYGVNVVGMIKDVPQLVKKYDVGVIILADNHKDENGYHPIFNVSSKTKAKLFVLPDFLSVFNHLTSESGMIPITASSVSGEDDMPCLQCMATLASRARQGRAGHPAGRVPGTYSQGSGSLGNLK